MLLARNALIFNTCMQSNCQEVKKDGFLEAHISTHVYIYIHVHRYTYIYIICIYVGGYTIPLNGAVNFQKPSYGKVASNWFLCGKVTFPVFPRNNWGVRGT